MSAEFLEEVRSLRDEIESTEKELSKKKIRLAQLTGEGMWMDGVRDPKFPCPDFKRGKPAGECESDGHYICSSCVNRIVCRGCGKHPEDCKCEPGV